MSRKNRAPKRRIARSAFGTHHIVLSTALCLMVNVVQLLQSFTVPLRNQRSYWKTMHLKYLKQLWKKTSCLYLKYARRVGGSNYHVPVEVRPERRTTLGLRWLAMDR